MESLLSVVVCPSFSLVGRWASATITYDLDPEPETGRVRV